MVFVSVRSSTIPLTALHYTPIDFCSRSWHVQKLQHFYYRRSTRYFLVGGGAISATANESLVHHGTVDTNNGVGGPIGEEGNRSRNVQAKTGMVLRNQRNRRQRNDSGAGDDWDEPGGQYWRTDSEIWHVIKAANWILLTGWLVFKSTISIIFL